MDKTYALNMQLLSLKQKNAVIKDYAKKYAIKIDELDIIDKMASTASQDSAMNIIYTYFFKN